MSVWVGRLARLSSLLSSDTQPSPVAASLGLGPYSDKSNQDTSLALCIGSSGVLNKVIRS